jgi:hypothetical protein
MEPLPSARNLKYALKDNFFTRAIRGSDGQMTLAASPQAMGLHHGYCAQMTDLLKNDTNENPHHHRRTAIAERMACRGHGLTIRYAVLRIISK